MVLKLIIGTRSKNITFINNFISPAMTKIVLIKVSGIAILNIV